MAGPHPPYLSDHGHKSLPPASSIPARPPSSRDGRSTIRRENRFTGLWGRRLACRAGGWHLVSGVVVVVVLWLIGGAASAADRDQLLFHAETLEGKVLASQGADTPLNPASLVKVGTTLWALESLGAEHRYRTVFGIDGEWDKRTGRLVGSLVVQGWGDPDFQPENVFLVARLLNQLRLFRVEGWLRIDGDFWIGWENGVANRLPDPEDRAQRMGRRLRTVLDPHRWDESTRAAWEAMCERRGWKASDPPRVEIVGSTQPGAPGDWTPVVVHRSNLLPVLLRRFDVYSNNDIIRVAENLGGPAALEAFLERRLELAPRALELETASGEERNRLTPRTGVRLMRAFVQTAGKLGLAPADLLPVIGCDPGSTDRKFPKLALPERAGSVVVKTGTLINTDGGVAVVGGVFSTPANEIVLFCIGARRTGWKEPHWRGLQQSWLLDLIDQAGGAVQRPCGEKLPFSDTYAEVEWVVSWESL
jgi:D-alanyl-D-alanine carboxypeptidase/D-alanyl-D-alanine-endopeptidase (penicillin-binding protein 4)